MTRELFLSSGLVAVRTASTVRDCARLLMDFFQAGVSLDLLPSSKTASDTVAHVVETLDQDETVAEGLAYISELVSDLVVQVAVERRRDVSKLYDVAKHLQSFHSLLANRDIQHAVRQVLDTETLLMHKDSVGIRIDLPNEVTQLTELHQEFHSFPFGLNAAVLWVPLTRVSQRNGTLAYFPREHLSAPIRFVGDPKEQDRLLAQGRLQEAQKAGRLDLDVQDLGPVSYLEAEPGQCFIFSTVLPHASVPAHQSVKRARLTCQARFFDVNDRFFAWKHQRGPLWGGLKQPSVGWGFWEDYSGA